MYIEIVKAHTGFVFHWPEGTEDYDPVIEVRVFDASYTGAFILYVAYGYRRAFGATRRRVLVFRNENDVLAEFVGVDDWEKDKRIATFLRHEDSRRLLRPDEILPSCYKEFNVVDSRSVVTGPYAPTCAAAVVDEADIPSIVGAALARERGESYGTVQEHRRAATSPMIESRQFETEEESRRAVVRELLAYRARQKTGGPFTRSRDADKFLRRSPFAFLMAASIDRGARAETVWEVPFLLYRSLGHLDPHILSELSIDQAETLLRSLERLPRYTRQAAHTIVDLSKLLVDRFDGDAEKVWRNRVPREVIRTLKEVWGVGPGISNMAVRILLDEFGYDPGPDGLRQIDIKPDTQVTKVFCRTGLSADRSEGASVEAARRLHPEFPGLLDWPAWEIGRTWCLEHNPKCTECPLVVACPRLGTRPE